MAALTDEYNPECSECCNVRKLYEGVNVTPDLLMFHVSYLLIRERKSKMKLKTRDNLHRMINALQNTRGGTILIHIEGVNKSDRCLEFFDEFIYGIFPAVTEDGRLSSEIFIRGWLLNVPGFYGNRGFVYLVVEPTLQICTMAFNTKVRTDLDNVNATNRCILSLLNGPNKHHSEKPQMRGLDLQGECEDRYREYKSIHHTRAEILLSPIALAEYIWRELKMRDNVTSMSKQVQGGSYYVGISEKTVEFQGYHSKVPAITGFEMKMKGYDLKTSLLELSHRDLVVLTLEGGFTEAPDDLFEIAIHSVYENRYVLEVAVRHFSKGVVFYDSKGPSAYYLKNKKIMRMPKEDWFHRLMTWDT